MATVDRDYSIPFNNDPLPRPPVREGGNDLDKNAFLTLLITQLRHQDPLNPMDDREFIAQLAQFTALEQMQNLNSTFNRFQAFNMVGSFVSGMIRNPATGGVTEVVGVVDSVRMINGEPWLVILRGDQEDLLRASDVQNMANDSAEMTRRLLNDMHTSMTTTNFINQSLALVGRHIQAVSGGANPQFIEGKVEFVDFTGPVPLLAIGNARVSADRIVSIGDRMMILGQHIDLFADGQVVTGGVIESIRIDGANAYAVIGGNEHRIDQINFITEALNLRRSGEAVQHMDYPHVVTGVHIQNNAIWVTMQNQETNEVIRLPFSVFIGATRPDADSDDGDDDAADGAAPGTGSDD